MNPFLLHVGFYNYVFVDHVVAIVDSRIGATRKLIKQVKVEKPRSILDLTRGRKCLSLLILTGDRYILSAISRKALVKRVGGTVDETEDLGSEAEDSS